MVECITITSALTSLKRLALKFHPSAQQKGITRYKFKLRHVPGFRVTAVFSRDILYFSRLIFESIAMKGHKSGMPRDLQRRHAPGRKASFACESPLESKYFFEGSSLKRGYDHHGGSGADTKIGDPRHPVIFSFPLLNP
jgi:hypothetical protein